MKVLLCNLLNIHRWYPLRSGWYVYEEKTSYGFSEMVKTRTIHTYIVIEKDLYTGQERAFKVVDDKSTPLNPVYAHALLDEHEDKKL